MACGDFIDEFAFALGQRPAVIFLIVFLEFFKDLPFFHGLDQGLPFLTRFALGSRDELLLSVDVVLQPLQIGLEQQHVRSPKTLALFAALLLQTPPAGVLPFSQDGLFIGESTACLGKLLLEAFLGMASGGQQ